MYSLLTLECGEQEGIADTHQQESHCACQNCSAVRPQDLHMPFEAACHALALSAIVKRFYYSYPSLKITCTNVTGML